MLDYYNQGKLNDESFVACIGMKSWTKYKDIELTQTMNSFTPNDFIDMGFDTPNNQTYYNQSVNTVPNQRSNNNSFNQNIEIKDKPPFTTFEKLGIIGISLIIGLVGLIVGIINVKYPSRKKFSIFLIVFYAILLIFTMSSFLSIGKGDDTSRNTLDNVTKSSQSQNIEYTHYDVSELVNDLNSNAMKAQSKYKDQYLEITGRLNNIDSDGTYISLEPTNDEWSFYGVQCFINTDEQKNKVMEMTIGDTVTLRGKCTVVGEVLGYSLDITEIK